MSAPCFELLLHISREAQRLCEVARQGVDADTDAIQKELSQVHKAASEASREHRQQRAAVKAAEQACEEGRQCLTIAVANLRRAALKASAEDILERVRVRDEVRLRISAYEAMADEQRLREPM